MVNSSDVKIVLHNLEKRLQSVNIPLGSFRNEPDSLAKRLSVHYNTIANWKASDWQQMKVEHLIKILDILQKVEHGKQ